MKKHFGRLFEIFVGLLATFAVVALLFAGLYYTFGFIKKGLNANAVYSDIANFVGPSDWLFITIITSVIMVGFLWLLEKKRIFQVSF